MDGSEEGRCPFGIAGGNSSPALEVEHGVFHQMAEFIEVLVVIALDDPVPFGRNDRAHSLPGRLFKNGVGIVAPVGQKMPGSQAFDEVSCLCAIRCGTWRNKNSDRQTMRIHGQMYLGVEPPFVRPMAWLALAMGRVQKPASFGTALASTRTMKSS